MDESNPGRRRARQLLWDQGATATDDEERDMRHVVHSRLRLDQTTPVNPFEETDVLKGLDFSCISYACMKEIVKKICAALVLIYRVEMSFNGIEKFSNGRLGLQGACSHRGKPPPKKNLRAGGRGPSKRCGCKFCFTLFCDGSLEFKTHNGEQVHSPSCQQLTGVQLGDYAALQKMLISPGKVKEITGELGERWKCDGTQKRSQISSDAFVQVQKHLPEGFVPARSFLSWICGEAKSVASDHVSPESEPDELLKFLRSDPERFVVSPLPTSDAAAGDKESNVAISWIDKSILPEPSVMIELLMSDVTFGVTSKKAGGFEKFDMVLGITPDGKAFPLTQSVITNEKSVTFEHNFILLLQWKPSLKTDVFVLLIDGDPAKILAARTIFQNVVIVLCLFHLTLNMHKRGNLFSHAEGMERLYICNCRTCGREVPFDSNFKPEDAVTLKCEVCSRSHEIASMFSMTSRDQEADVSIPATTTVARPHVNSWFSFGDALAAVNSAVSAAASWLPSHQSSSQQTVPDGCAVGISTEMNWKDVWPALRNAATVTECKRLLDAVARQNPKLKGYMEFMWRNIGLWAKCCFVWQLTLG
jgi:hypothetical protein